MEVIPVLDLMEGRVVQGLRGERERYRAVRSGLVGGSDPEAVAEALLRVCGGKSVYLADLDALSGAGDHLGVVRDLQRHLGAEPLVDAGVCDRETAARLLDAGAARVIVGTETLTSLDALRRLRVALPGTQTLVSVDVGMDGVISRCPALVGLSPLAALELLTAEGIAEVILLALPQVGTGAGPDLQTLVAARAAYPHLRLIAGGGVRSPDDLRALSAAGADGVLLATALHRGWITADDVRTVGSGLDSLTSAP